MVEELFKIYNCLQPLPVRFKDFQRNIKRHYAKLLKVLQAYAVSSVNVKMCVFNITGKNATRNVVLATQAQQTMGDNIANVFGTKFLRTLVRVDFMLNCSLSDENERDYIADQVDSDEKHGLFASGIEPKLRRQERKVEGYVSKVGAGVGRCDNDRLFCFINGRPFDLPKLIKTLNEVWRSYEMKQKPACILNFHLPFGDYDVNVTPDKRETFLKHEAEINEAFKTGLSKIYEPSRGVMTVQPLIATFTRASETELPLSELPLRESISRVIETESSSELKRCSTAENTPTSIDQMKSHNRNVAQRSEHVIVKDNQLGKNQSTSTDAATDKPTCKTKPVVDLKQASTSKRPAASHSLSSKPIRLDTQQPAKRRKLYSPVPSQPTSCTSEKHLWSFQEMMQQRQQYFEEEVEYERERLINRLKVPKVCSASVGANMLSVDNEAAAAALQRVIKKDDFKRMKVLGQFNLGFIIAKLDNDLFIIDQHASDEKYNYETLQQTTVIHQQPLVRPLMLEMTAGEELIILDHLNVFAKNGFTFLVNKAAPATKKLKLVSLPFTKHTQFDSEDIRELVSLLIDAPLNPDSIRLPKLMATFASRACRSSIMIGTALHKEDMQKIVRNLSELDQPWNCPHGRPTLRHLVDLTHLQYSDDSN
ncbi:putative ribosomal protein S5 domain 2-type [Plasmopara halstedii]